MRVEATHVVGDNAGEHVKPPGGAFRIGRGGGARAATPGSRSAARYRRSRSPAPRRRPISKLMQLQVRRYGSATVAPGPGRKLARTRYAVSPRRRSRLAGWIWLSTKKSCSARMHAGLRHRRDHPVWQDTLFVGAQSSGKAKVSMSTINIHITERCQACAMAQAINNRFLLRTQAFCRRSACTRPQLIWQFHADPCIDRKVP